MPLEKDFSVVADSTASLSPAADASIQIKRAVRTYGKRHNEMWEEPTDSTSQHSIHNTAPPGLQETVPPSSPAKPMTSAVDELGLGEACNAFREPVFQCSSGRTQVDQGSGAHLEDSHSSKFKYGWRKRLDEMNEESDMEDNITSTEAATQKVSYLFGNATLLQEAKDDAKQLDSAMTESTPLPSVANDVFTCPLPSPSGSRAPEIPFALLSPAVAQRSRRRRQRILVKSDSEDEHPKDSSSTAPSTSGNASLESPRTRSSSTQPTSDEELPSKVSVAPKKANRPGSVHLSVPPLEVADLSSNVGKKGTRDRKGKSKAPTKKELKETAKGRARLATETKVIIPRAGKSSKYTLERLLTAVSAQSSQTQVSDPIEPFTSSPAKEVSPTRECPQVESLSSVIPAEHVPGVEHPDSDESEEELPEIEQLLRQDAEKRSAEELKRIKMLVLKQPKVVTYDDGDDDELVVSTDPKATLKEEEEHRRSKQARFSTAHKIIARYGNVKTTKKATVISPGRIRKDFTSAIQDPSLTNQEFTRIMHMKVQEHASREIRKKEEEWTKHGGHLAAKVSVPAEGLELTVKAIAGQGLQKVKAWNSHRMEVDGDSSEEDEEWTPDLRGSASPAPGEGPKNEARIDDKEFGDADITMVAEEDWDDADADADKTKVHRSRRNLVLDSEEEDADENAPVKSMHQKSRRSSTSSVLATEDENDKENNTKLMYDQGEDKENVRVARHSPPKRHSIFDLTERGLASSSPVFGSERNDFEDGSVEQRRPFQDLMPKESPESKLLSPSTLTQQFANQLHQTSPLPCSLAPAPSLKPFLAEGGSSTSFSQFSQLEPTVFAAAPLQPGFSELFESGTEKEQISNNGLNEFSNENLVARELKRAETLGLTQDVSADLQLQPAFQPEETLVRKAAAILEKEQAFVIEVNATNLVRKNTELYVNELGFLTQTKPVDGTPDVYRRFSPRCSALSSMVSPFESHMQVQTPSQRIPLQTLSLASVTQCDSPRPTSFHRLRRAGDTPPSLDDRSPTVSPPVQQPQVLDAHEALRRGQELERKKQEKKRKRSELGGFLEDEAAESDDEMFGFVAKKPVEDDEEGEDLDQNLPGLVDDQVMDAETEAADLVLDKYKEHLGLDDKQNEELHQAAAQGRLRKRRKHGVGVDDSDEESDADDNERARRAMKRARTSARTDIKGLEANEETRAFADSYNQSLRDDEDDFAYLSKNVYRHTEEEVETVDAQDVYRAIREQAREGHLSAAQVDLHDVSWIEQDEDMENVPRVRSIDTRQRPKQRQHSDLSGLDTSMGPAFRKSTSLVSAASKQWGAHARESNSRNTATARSGGVSAITGHAKARPRTGVMAGESIRKGRSSEDSKVKPVRAVASGILSADKSRSFA